MGHGAAVFNCEGSGDRTILHPTNYDVCEACVLRHSVGGDGAWGAAQEAVLRRVHAGRGGGAPPPVDPAVAGVCGVFDV